VQVDPKEIRGICASIKASGIKAITISSCYAPLDREIRQEELVRDIVRSELPDAYITISKEVANIGESMTLIQLISVGLHQRENAAILNSSLLPFAAHTIAGFKQSMSSLQLTCPLFLTTNDGTLMSCEQAAELPIKTFSSGPTNSMRGASFLAQLEGGQEQEMALVLDVGGTTVGLFNDLLLTYRLKLASCCMSVINLTGKALTF
jgi:N-methylhydantoinase A/oxoprolinase/acetone carboxylase beta subunit